MKRKIIKRGSGVLLSRYYKKSYKATHEYHKIFSVQNKCMNEFIRTVSLHIAHINITGEVEMRFIF